MIFIRFILINYDNNVKQKLTGTQLSLFLMVDRDVNHEKSAATILIKKFNDQI